MALTGQWRCNDGGSYWIRELDDGAVFWFGKQSISFANIFKGTRTGNIVQGNFMDVPLGNARGHGNLELTINSSENRISRPVGGGFGGTEWVRESTGFSPISPGSRADILPARFQGGGLRNLSGTWTSETGAIYYVRDIPETGMFGWFAQHPDRNFANVLVGQRSGRNINARWADLPVLGRQANHGEITNLSIDPSLFDFTAGATMRRDSGSSARIYRRFESAQVEVHFQELEIIDLEESGGDEPYVWLFVIKLDDDTVRVFEAPAPPSRPFEPTVLATSGSHNNLTESENIGVGTRLVIPREVGYFSTTIRTVGGLTPRSVPSNALTTLMVVAIAWEEDGSTDASINAAYSAAQRSIKSRGAPLINQAWKSAVRAVTDALVAGEPVDFNIDPNPIVGKLIKQVKEDALDAAIAAGGVGGFFSSLFASPDDLVGAAYNRFGFDQLIAGTATSSKTIDLELRLQNPSPGGLIGVSPWSDPRVRYQLRGHIIVFPTGVLI